MSAAEVMDLAHYNSMTTLERATLIHGVWTEKGFKAPDKLVPNLGGIEGALGYLELIINYPDSPRIESYFLLATNLIQIWGLFSDKSKAGQPQP